jgi:sortase A
MTDAQRLDGGAAETDADGAAHPPRPAGEAAPPGEPGTGFNGDPADGSDRPAGSGPDVPGEGLATGGAPFGRLGELRPGDTITATTGQGTSTYTVAAAAYSDKIIEDPVPNRMLLLTASSAGIPSYHYQVDARLTSSVRPSPGVATSVYASELPLANDSSTLSMAMVWSLALALVAAIGTVAAARWSRWAAYLAMVPLALAVLWNLYENLAALLPNLY